jgi:hypothetical protein
LRCVKHAEKRRAALVGFLAVVGGAASARAEDAKPVVAGADFAAEAKVLMKLVACAGDADLPDDWPKPVLKQHCLTLADKAGKYRTRWVDRVRPYLARIVPTDLPKRVVYPFGGGDLVTALAVFPNADELTTISLETAGDIRGLGGLTRKQLKASLDETREHLRCLFAVSHSKTTNLKAGSHSSLPGEIAFALAAFSVFDLEPVSLRYFRLDPQGGIVYLPASELGEVGAPRAKDSPNPFANVEIAFRPRRDPHAPVRVFRHIRGNLQDDYFHANGPLAMHLAGKGDVAALIKAASYLLWFDGFSHIRAYLLDHAVWMLSDSTGIPPRFARAAGFEQEPFGVFHGPMLAQYSYYRNEFQALWQASPKRMLPFYFGYPDSDGHGHMMITRRTGKLAPSETSAPATDQVSGGNHWRLLTDKGPVHVWQPRGYDPSTAGTVVYVHGYYTNVDGAWVQHALAEQFAASKQNALFIVPEAPSGGNDEVSWPALADLLQEVERQLDGIKARPPIVITGHSGAWRTLSGWTEDPRVECIVLLDGLYGGEDKFQAWLGRHPGTDEPRLTLVSRDTASRVAPFVEGLSGVKRRASLPETYRDLTAAERTAPVLEIQSELGHMEIITSGKVLPVLLHRSPLKAVKPPRFVKPKKGVVTSQ